DAVLQFPSFTFDSSVEDIFTPLISGSKLVLIRRELRLNLDYLTEVIKKNRVTHILMVPALYKTFLANSTETLKSLEHITLGGEHFTEELVKEHFTKLGHVRLVNEYGPTENSVCSTVYEFNPVKPEVVIGKPIGNGFCYILDKNYQLAPVGVSGELYLSGAGVARGYLNRPELTHEKFVHKEKIAHIPWLAPPSSPTNQSPRTDNRLYSTGDLARWLPQGNIQFLGRIDHQVKIRGFRIELAEIENLLLSHENIKETVVTAKKNNENNDYLAAYYVYNKTNTDAGTNEQPAPVSIPQLRDFLSEKLPDYMIPAYFVPLEKLPLTANGKIDRKALPEPGKNARSSKGYRAPTNETEKKLVEIWQEVLGLKPIGITDNFFEMGGHSLKAITIISKIKKIFQVELPLPKLFENPFIKNQAQDITHSVKSIFTAVQAVEKKDYYPVSAAQKRLYALNRFTPDSVNYNMPGALLIEGELSAAYIEEAFQKLIHRHESLRTSFFLNDATPVQRVHSPDEIVFAVTLSEGENNYSPCTGQKDDHSEESSAHPALTRFLRPFDLSSAPLLRVELVKLEENKYIFLCDMHHIVSDGVSMNILVKEFSTLYAGMQLKPLNLQYKEYAAWQNRLLESEGMLKQKKYWQDKFT
ncbi:MAG: AMP-binding protein, partial [bacterium]|nr:AMP-binding protein [bacterium]